jgi:hypothetical protein
LEKLTRLMTKLDDVSEGDKDVGFAARHHPAQFADWIEVHPRTLRCSDCPPFGDVLPCFNELFVSNWLNKTAQSFYRWLDNGRAQTADYLLMLENAAENQYVADALDVTIGRPCGRATSGSTGTSCFRR